MKNKKTRSNGSCIRRLFQVCIAVLTLCLITAIALGIVLYLIYDHVVREGVPGPVTHILIPQGVTGAQTGEILAEAGLVEHAILFRAAVWLDKTGKTVKHGEYEIPVGLSPRELLEVLDRGPTWTRPGHIITIPEGLTIAQIAERLPDPQAFIDAASSQEHIQRLGIEADTLEGFLMPNTYFFDKEPAAAELVETMVSQFEREYTRLTETLPLPDGFDMMDVVIMASIVERESVVQEERALVASVIFNRLEKGMTLDMDSTLQYALNKYGQRMLNEDKEVDSPYNTYRRRGLPPAPIANPGVISLRAVLEPAEEEYLYFVSNADGRTHTFSKTLQEHNRAVSRYRTEITEQRRQLRDRQNNDNS